MVYAADCCSEDIRYSTGPSATGPWTYKGVIMASAGASFTNHPGIIDFSGNSYFFYHNGALPGGSGYTRSVCVEQFTYNSDGTIPTLKMTTSGPNQVGTLNPYVRVEAETMAWSSGVETEVCSEGGMSLSFLNNGDYVKLRGVAFGSGATSFSARVSSATSGGKIEIRLGSATGTLVGTCTVTGTGSWTTWTTVSCPVSGATGTQDLFLRFTGSGTDNLFNFNWWQFSNGSSGSGSPTTTAVSSASPTSSTAHTTTAASGGTVSLSCSADSHLCIHLTVFSNSVQLSMPSVADRASLDQHAVALAPANTATISIRNACSYEPEPKASFLLCPYCLVFVYSAITVHVLISDARTSISKFIYTSHSGNLRAIIFVGASIKGFT